MAESVPIDSFVDLHTYVGPGIVPRRFTVPSMAESEAGSLAGIGVWNHFFPTAPIIESIEAPDGLDLVGVTVLNRHVGGLNADAVEASAAISDLPTLTCFPTISAENFLAKSEYEVPPAWVDGREVSPPADEVSAVPVTDENGRLRPEARDVLHAIEATDGILGTGYASAEETVTLVEAAHDLGIRKITLTNPIYELIGMSLETQRRLASLDGVYVEHNFAMEYINGISYDRIVEEMRGVGIQNCVICSDMGQIGNPTPSEGLAVFCDELLKRGLPPADLVAMGRDNPRRLLDLE